MNSMNRQKTLKAAGLRGSNVYHFKDSRNVIYYDKLTKKAYIITDYDAPIFYSYQYRFPFCLIVGGLIVLFVKSYLIAGIVCVLMFILTTILYRIFFIRKLPVSEKFEKPESKGFVKDLVAKYSMNSLIIAVLLFGSAAASLTFNQLFRRLDGTKGIFIYICIGGFSLITLFIAYLIIIKKKEN